jgi:hypothetical protein
MLCCVLYVFDTCRALEPVQENSMHSLVKTWYSPRGVRRGLVLAMLTAAFWISWAVGYAQGCIEVSMHADTATRNRMILVDMNRPACGKSGDCS